MSVLFISGGEIIVVLVFVLIFFGSKSIPDIARSMGKGMQEFNKATREIKKEINESTSGLKDEIEQVKRNIGKGLE
jgi:sec-independent protein translocase protein TatA